MGDAGDSDADASPTPRILELFSQAGKDGKILNISAPMVRYSKLPFRLLVSQYGADIIYTPMMLAHEFIRSQTARDSDFTTHPLERREGKILIAQFASSEPEELARAADLISPWVDGVNLNCGCPQSWAIKEGIGCSLMEEPEKVAKMVKATKERLMGRGKSVSVKIRIDKNLEKTINWVRIVQDAGVDYITVHGRTRSQRSSTPPDYAAIGRLRAHIRVPMVANGDAYSNEDVEKIAAMTGVDGVMAARGLMENPTMFAGYAIPSGRSVVDFLQWAVRCPIPFPLVLHHVFEMTAKMEGTTKKEKKRLMQCGDLVDLIDFVEEKWGLER
ncbi:tRNA-dihydrouridine(20a/20b) synthase [NAD(P)+] [Pseudocercospora fuligena]|uniref:tRNA-dihydrouridine(20a/20b) synthase [NAD(P)+] n=1 Tax=Pseudocercospora fuligena TaxID=685502 RepID=A0A8H6RC99_9PEZI|nr:tRNA-dihydrouridine(20a/20b) synthase [NAD(P)+] [Pseudocercospora fuligena]